MATFDYNALTSSGRLLKGSIEASDDSQARELLGDMNLTINSLSKSRPQKAKTPIGRNEFILFNQQLASLTKAGIPLERGLRELVNDVGTRSMRKLILDIADDLEAGTSIEKAFEKRQKHFPVLYSQIIKAGTKTGRLSEMLISLNRHLEMANNTRRIVFEAICYPAVILSIAALIITFVFVVIIPQFRPIFMEFGTELPALTTILLSLCDHILPFWAIVGCVVAGLVLLKTALSSNKAGRRFLETLTMKIPVLGRVYRNGMLSRLADAMALLIASGSDVPDALRLGAGASGSEKAKLDCELLAKQIESGSNLTEAGQFCSTIPRLFVYAMQLGAQRNEPPRDDCKPFYCQPCWLL